jgi:hypothetical protein
MSFNEWLGIFNVAIAFAVMGHATILAYTGVMKWKGGLDNALTWVQFVYVVGLTVFLLVEAVERFVVGELRIGGEIYSADPIVALYVVLIARLVIALVLWGVLIFVITTAAMVIEKRVEDNEGLRSLAKRAIQLAEQNQEKLDNLSGKVDDNGGSGLAETGKRQDERGGQQDERGEQQDERGRLQDERDAKNNGDE